MNRRTIFIVILVIAVAVGAYFYTTGALKLPGSGEEPESAAAAAAAPAPMPMPMPPPAPPQMQAPPPVEEVQEPVGSHPFAGDKFLVTGNDANAVIVPIENDNRFKIDTSGARTNDMMVTLQPVDDQENTYFIKSKGVGKYIKYSNNGFWIQGVLNPLLIIIKSSLPQLVTSMRCPTLIMKVSNTFLGMMVIR
jgi:hypothetical protein